MKRRDRLQAKLRRRMVAVAETSAGKKADRPGAVARG
jgi:hypothetical protein